jgi:hypothetical protein
MFLPPEASEWAHEQESASSIQFIITTAGKQESASREIEPGIVLTHPDHNTTYRLVRTVPADTQRIEVKALPLVLDELAEVKLYVDETLLAALDRPPYSALWQLSTGEHTFCAEAIDQLGNIWSSQAVHITVLE